SFVDVPHRIFKLLRRILLGEAGQEGQIIINRARDDIEVEPLGGARLLVHEERKAFLRCVGQPLLNRQPIALRLRNLLSLLVEEELVTEAFRGKGAENTANPGGQLDRRNKILAAHLVRSEEHTSELQSR